MLGSDEILVIGAGGDDKNVGHAGDAGRGNSNRWSPGRSRCGGTILKIMLVNISIYLIVANFYEK